MSEDAEKPDLDKPSSVRSSEIGIGMKIGVKWFRVKQFLTKIKDKVISPEVGYVLAGAVLTAALMQHSPSSVTPLLSHTADASLIFTVAARFSGLIASDWEEAIKHYKELSLAQFPMRGLKSEEESAAFFMNLATETEKEKVFKWKTGARIFGAIATPTLFGWLGGRLVMDVADLLARDVPTGSVAVDMAKSIGIVVLVKAFMDYSVDMVRHNEYQEGRVERLEGLRRQELKEIKGIAEKIIASAREEIESGCDETRRVKLNSLIETGSCVVEQALHDHEYSKEARRIRLRAALSAFYKALDYEDIDYTKVKLRDIMKHTGLRGIHAR